jgi:hypothetical protein
MSNTQYAFIDKARVPDRAALQSSIDALGFDLKLHPEFSPFSNSGFLPFVLNGEEGPGFEIFYESTDDVVGGDKLFRALAEGRDHCISMSWRGDMKDLACVMIVSCALTKDFGAIVTYEGDDPESLDDMLEATQEIIRDAAEGTD